MKRLFLTARLFCAAVLIVPAQASILPASTNAPAVAVPPTVPFPAAIPAIQVITQSEATLVEHPAPGTDDSDQTAADVHQALLEKRDELKLFADTTSTSQIQNSSLDFIRSRTKYGEELAAFSAAWTKSLTGRAALLGKELDQIKAEQKIWQDTLGALQGPPPASAELIQRARNVLDRLANVSAEKTAQQTTLLQLENQVTDETTLINNALDRLSRARSRAVSELFERNAPPLWSWEAMPVPDDAGKLTWSKQWDLLTQYAADQQGKFLIHALLLILLIGCFYLLRSFARSIAQEADVAPAAALFEMPVAGGVLIAILVGWPLYYPVAPHLFFAILGAIALVPSVALLRHVVERRMFPVLYALVVFFLLENIRSVTAFHPKAEQTFLLAELLGAFSFLGWLILSLRREPLKQVSPLMRGVGWVAFLVLTIGWLTEVLGYSDLANLVCVGVQRSATIGLALYAGVRILEALLSILVWLPPLSQLGMMRDHRSLVLQRAQRILAWAAAAWWTVLTLELVPSTATFSEHLFGSSISRTRGWLGHYQGDGSYAYNFTGKLIIAALIIWGVFQVSRLVRFTLATDFYPRLRLGQGVPYAISTSLHYVLLVVAFIAATAVLGIDMTKFTILVSALGVGVGFGLQNIINNFVSGLILLFERPVKIGDTILTGTDSGTVERIGIRASVLRTASGTEVIVPNGTLISSNVTNWTLSNRERIILIPLSVLRGQDMAQVITLLTTTAAAHSLVLKNPPPQVIAQTLGPNLSLELRAWTGPAADWTQARSELVLAIDAALAREKITLA